MKLLLKNTINNKLVLSLLTLTIIMGCSSSSGTDNDIVVHGKKIASDTVYTLEDFTGPAVKFKKLKLSKNT